MAKVGCHWCCFVTSLPHPHYTSVTSGTIDFNLTGIPKPVKDAINCSMDQLPPEEETGNEGAEPVKKCRGSSDIKLINLFHKKRIKGWWPVFFAEEGERELTVSEIAWSPFT